MSSIIERAFNQAYNEAAEHYNNGHMEACTKGLQEILDDEAAPRYHRMKAWILLGNILEWDDANMCFLRAEAMLQIVERWHRPGEDPDADKAIEEVRGSLQELREALETDRPSNDDPQALTAADLVAAHDANAEEESMLAPEDDEPELERVEAEMGFTPDKKGFALVTTDGSSTSARPKIEVEAAMDTANDSSVGPHPTVEPLAIPMHPKNTTKRGYGLGGNDERVDEIRRKASWRA